jgi:hypothetical protein
MKSFRHFFSRMDTSSTNKTNKFIPYHLIISKHKYYGIKLYIFHDLFMHYIFCDVWVFYKVVVLRHRSMDTKIHPIFQPIEKSVTWKIKWFVFLFSLFYLIWFVFLIGFMALRHVSEQCLRNENHVVKGQTERRNIYCLLIMLRTLFWETSNFLHHGSRWFCIGGIYVLHTFLVHKYSYSARFPASSSTPTSMFVVLFSSVYVDACNYKMDTATCSHCSWRLGIKSSIYSLKALLFLKNGRGKNCRKNYENHYRSNNYEACTAVACCFPNILDVMALENLNLSSDKIGRPPLWSNETASDFCHMSPTYAVSSVYFNHTLISYVQVFNFSEKITWFAFYLVLWTMNWIQYKSHHLFCNYYHIQCVCNHSTDL